MKPSVGLSRLIKVVQKHYPILDNEEAVDAIVEVKAMNDGFLNGLKKEDFLKLLNKS